MTQGSDTAQGRPVLLIGGVGDLNESLAFEGWSPIPVGPAVALDTAFLDSPVQIVLANLAGRAELPSGWAALADAVAARRGALVATGSPSMIRDALRAGATHAAAGGSAAMLGLALLSAVRHVERLAAVASDPASGGWIGPGGALARIDAALAGNGRCPALLVVLERFEVVNAAWGRAVGDRVLERAARRIARAADASPGPEAEVLRVAGAEFLVLPGPAARAATTDAAHGNGELGEEGARDRVAERIAARLAAPFLVADASVSVGHRIAGTAARPGEDGAALLDRLRGAVELARADAPAPDEDDPDGLAVDLHHAIRRGEVELLFQPQVALANGRIEGVEALARWAHPRLGMLGAEPLLAAAARAGLAGSLSAHIQSLAFAAAAGWSGRLAALHLAINVTAQDIAAPGFAARLLARLDASGLAPDRLTLEVTETGLILDLEGAAAALAVIRQAGCRVALDDFGTGYSSLAYLKTLPIDYLKVDKALTRDVTGSARDRAVLDGVVGIARALGIGTIVEGVETAVQRDRLAAMGCDLYQGFLCAEPIGADALARLMEER